MSDTAPKSKKEWLRNIEDYLYLKNLAEILIGRGKTLLTNDRSETWDTICKKASGKFFKYEYIADAHLMRITDKGNKRFYEKKLPSAAIHNGKLTPLAAPAT